MVNKNIKKIVGSSKQKQKNLSNSMITAINKYRRQLQKEENIKYGRKAKAITFVYATKSPQAFANFILKGGLK